MLTPIDGEHAARRAARRPAPSRRSRRAGSVSDPGAMTAPRTMKRCPSGSWMFAPRTVNDAVRTGGEHRRVGGDGERDERHRGREQELLPHTTYVSHRPSAITARAGGSCIRCLRAHRFPRTQRDRDHRRARARGQPRRAFARVQLPARGAGGSGRLGLAHRHLVDPERRDRPRGARRRWRTGKPLYAVDAELLEQPRARPDRDPGPVRGLRRAERRGAARRRASGVETLSLDPRDLGEIEESIRTLARHLARRGPGELLAQAMHHRIDGVRQAGAGPARACACSSPSGSIRRSPPATGCPRWSSSPEARRCSAARASARSPTTWEAVADAAPQLLVLAPCGFDLERTVSEAGGVPAMGARVVAVDGDAAYSRPGPRVAEGVAQLAHLMHPEAVAAPSLPLAPAASRE